MSEDTSRHPSGQASGDAGDPPPEPALAHPEAVVAPGLEKPPPVDRPVPLSPLERLGFLFVTCFGVGHAPVASGTWGSMPAPAAVGLLFLLGISPLAHPWAYNAGVLAVAVVFFAACVLLGPKIERRFGQDPSQCVADEVAGMAIVLLFPPPSAFESLWSAAGYLAVAFVLFRAFDIIKVQPANSAQDLPHGWGIATDDVIAGAYALLCLQVLWRSLF